MNLLIIGGTRFVGYLLAWRMLARGHTVTLFNRGNIPDPFDTRVTRIKGDRTTPDFHRLLANKQFDAVIDFAAYTGTDARSAVDTFKNNIGHYVFISTGQVYLVRTNAPRPAREEDYAGPVMPEPPEGHPERNDWLYGIHKRTAEDVLTRACAESNFPETRLRIPMVNGERDFYRRLENYFWRLLDSGPLLLPDVGPQICRHIYGWEVIRAIELVLANPATKGKAYNLCQQEQPPLADLLPLIANLLGTPSPRLVPIAPQQLAARNMPLKSVSPFSDTWMSHLDPTLAQKELGFTHEPLDRYLEKIITTFLAHPPADKPPAYARRAEEIALAMRSP